MISKFFLNVLNMNLTGSIVILIVLVARTFLRKAPKRFSYVLWSVVLFRLVCPFQIESIFSILPIKANPIPQNIVYAAIPRIDTGIPAMNLVVNASLPAATPYASINPLQGWVFLGAVIWIAGIIVLLFYCAMTSAKLQRHLNEAVFEKENIYLVEQLDTPFVMGILRPNIYLPSALTEQEKKYIVLHEQCHIRRFDHVVKIVSFFVLCLHWFNPLVWIAFFLSGSDMEMSCDEMVVSILGDGIKRDYTSSLLSLATGRRYVGGSPLAFGEGDTKKRIKHVLNYQKPSFWLILMTVAIVGCIIVGLMTNPKGKVVDAGGVNAVILEIDRVNLTMTVEGIDENSIIGDLCVLTWQGNPFITVATNSEPKRLSLDDFSVGDYVVLSIGEVQESYPTKTMATTILLRPKEMLMDTYSTVNLWNARTLYVGDNSAVGKLIGLLPITDGLQYDHFELHTDVRPYFVDIVYVVPTKTISEYEADERVSNLFYNNALVLLTLIENVDGIRVRLTDGTQELDVIIEREWVEVAIGRDLRDYAQSPEMLQELMKHFAGVAQEVTEFGAYPQNYSVEQGVKDGFFVVVHGVVKGQTQTLMDDFLQSLEDMEPAQIRLLQYTIEGDPMFASIVYHGGNAPIVVNFDMTRDRFGVQTTSSIQAKYVRKLMKENTILICLTDHIDLTIEDALMNSSDSLVVIAYEKER